MCEIGAILAEHAVEMGRRQRIVGEVGRIALLQPGQQIERRCNLGFRAAGMHPLDIEDEDCRIGTSGAQPGMQLYDT